MCRCTSFFITIRYLAIITITLSLFFFLQVRVYAQSGDLQNRFSLDDAIATALKSSPYLNAVKLGIKEATHKSQAARADFFPKLETGYSYSRLNEPTQMKIPHNKFFPDGFRVKVGTEDIYRFHVGLAQPLFTGGSLLNRYRLEELGVNIARVKTLIAESNIILDVKVVYFNIIKAEKIMAVSAQTVRQLASHEKRTRDFFKQEMIPKNNLLEAQVRLAQARQDLIKAENAVLIAKSLFNRLLHRNVNSPVKVIDVLESENMTITLPECQSKALKSRPVLKEINLLIKKAQKDVDLVKSNYFPAAYLLADYSLQGDKPGVDGTKYEDRESWNVTFSMQWTFWEWGKTTHRVGEKRVRLLRTRETCKELIDQVNLEVKTAFLNMQEAHKNIVVADEAIEHAVENFRIYTELFNQQMSTTTDVLDAQTLLARAKVNYTNSLSDYRIAKAGLEWAISEELK